MAPCCSAAPTNVDVSDLIIDIDDQRTFSSSPSE